jgi:monoamine oxidase
MDQRALESRCSKSGSWADLLIKYADVLRAPCGTLHFVGTETTYEWKGYVNGAISSGERGTQELMQALGKSASSQT